MSPSKRCMTYHRSDCFRLSVVPAQLIFRIISLLSANEFVRVHRTCKALYKLCHFRNHVANLDIHLINLSRRPNEKKIRSSQRKTTQRAWELVEVRRHDRWSNQKNMAETVAETLPFRCRCKTMDLWSFCSLTSLLIKKLIEMAKTNKLTVEKLSISGQLDCTPDELKKFVEILHVKSIIISKDRWDKDYYTPKIFQNVPRIYHPDDFHPRHLLQMKQQSLKLKCEKMTERYLNLFLKEWLNNERKIETIDIDGAQIYNAEDIFNGLPAHLLYNSSHHENSILSHLPYKLNSIFYVLIKPEDLEDTLLLFIDPQGVHILKCYNPIDGFFEEIGNNKRDIPPSKLLEMKETCIDAYCTDMTGKDLNMFLKQWLNNDRTILRTDIRGGCVLSPEEVFKDLPASLLYNFDSHYTSVIWPLNPYTLPVSISGSIFYILIKPNNLNDCLMVEITFDIVVRINYCYNCPKLEFYSRIGYLRDQLYAAWDSFRRRRNYLTLKNIEEEHRVSFQIDSYFQMDSYLKAIK